MPDGRFLFVVDDDDDTRSCVCTVLEEEGYRVASARNGKDALDKLSKMPRPDIVLLDLMMPVMSGWEVLEACEADPSLRGLTVVVFTAAGDSTVSTEQLHRPVLRKPIDLELLLETVHKLCRAESA